MLNLKDFAFMKDRNSISTFRSDIMDVELASTMTVKSHHTGKEKEFIFNSYDRDEEGDITAWIFKSNDGMKMVIFND